MWPAGVFSSGKSFCAKGYTYSYQKNACFIDPPANNGFDLCPLECFHAGEVCGPAWVTHTQGKDCNSGCQHICYPHNWTRKDNYADHFVCREGAWINAGAYSDLTIGVKHDSFSYNSGLGWKGVKDPFLCTFPDF